MDPYNDDFKCENDFSLIKEISTNEEKDLMFNTLLQVLSIDNYKKTELLNHMTNDNCLINILNKTNNESDVIFVMISRAIHHSTNDIGCCKQVCNNWNYNHIFKQQCTEIDGCFLPSIKDFRDKEKKSMRFRQFIGVYFLFNCLSKLQTLYRDFSQIENANKINRFLLETEEQLMNHITLIINTTNLVGESVLLPFVVDNEQFIPMVTKLALYLFKKYGFDSTATTGFYSVFGNILINMHNYIINYPVESPHHELLLRTLYQLMQIKSSDSSFKYPIVALIAQLPVWKIDFVTDSMGKEFERLTFLGTFLSGSMFADDDSEIAFNHFKDENLHEIELVTEQKFLQSKLETLWEFQFQILKLLLVEKSTHESTIDYLNQALYVNKTRSHMQPEESIASGEGFITNLNAVLQRLVSPIKLDKVDVDFLTIHLLSANEYNLGKLLCKETRIYFDNEAMIKQCHTLTTERKSVEATNFHTNIFFLSAVGHHYGIIASIRKQSRRSTAIQSLERSINEISRILETTQIPTAQVQSQQKALNRYKSMVSYQKRAILCSQVVLYHETYLRSSLEFYIQVAKVLSSTIAFDMSLGTTILHASNSFSATPQFLLDDMADFLLFIMSKKPSTFDYINYLNDICSFVIFISTHSHLVKSPYLVAKFVEVIFSFLPSVNNDPHLYSLYQCFLNHFSVTSGFLTNRLIQFYIEVEKTGASSEFYDKFSIRFKISIIFRSLWKHNSQMKIHLLNEVENNLDQFVKFINRAMNDMVYLLDESITALKRIRTNQEKKNDQQQWTKCTRQEQTAILQQLNHDERSTKSQLTLADVTVEMLYDFTHEIKDPFLCSELVEKLVANINSFLLELVGPKCKDLKVNDPEKYNWNPKKLLQNIIRIYLNLDSPELIEAISNEERFYSSELFINALSKLDNYNIISKHELEHLDIFRQKIETLVKQRETDDAFLDSVPSEYLDPIMSCIMKEPVMLPQSKIIVDKSVIKRHLLNDDCDPFNRQPLKLEDLIPQPQLQKEIEDWKKNRQKTQK